MIESLIEKIFKQTETTSDNDKDNKETIFKLPIEYLSDKVEIEEHTINDLELIKDDKHDSLYKYVFNHKYFDT